MYTCCIIIIIILQLRSRQLQAGSYQQNTSQKHMTPSVKTKKVMTPLGIYKKVMTPLHMPL